MASLGYGAPWIGGRLVRPNTPDIHDGKAYLKDDHGVCAITCRPDDPQDIT